MDQSIVKEILSKVSIEKVISQYINITPSGKDYKALCPFHNDTRPSLYISVEKQIYKCFTCGEGGNAITFLMNYNNINFEEALTILADMAGVQLNIKVSKEKLEKNRLLKINKVTSDFYCVNLINEGENSEAYTYLLKRGLSPETIDKFQIGLSPNDYELTRQMLDNRGFSELDMLNLGLITANLKNAYFDTFRNKIMFPIHSEHGEILGFSARKYSLSDTSQAKYVNSKESVIFKKNNIVYNLHNAKEAIKKDGFVYILEGFMDVIALDNIGIENCVATMGTAFTENHIKTITKYTNNFVLLFDGDNAGVEAAFSAIKKLKDYNASVVIVPDKLDPDEYIKKYSKDKFIELLKNKMSFEIFNYYYLSRQVDIIDQIKVESLKKEIFKYLYDSNSKDNVLKILELYSNTYMKQYSEVVNEFNRYTKNKFNLVINGPTGNYFKKSEKHSQKSQNLNEIEYFKKYYDAEKFIIREMIENHEYCLNISYVLGDLFADEVCYSLRIKLLNYYVNEKETKLLNEEQFKTLLNNDLLNKYLEIKNIKRETNEVFLNDCLKCLKEYPSIIKQKIFENVILNKKDMNDKELTTLVQKSYDLSYEKQKNSSED